MKKIDLRIKEVIDQKPPQERGMIVAERAVKSAAMLLLSRSGNRSMTKEEARRYLDDGYPEYRDLVETTLSESCLPEYPEIYKKADRWLTDNLINAWKEEYIDYHFVKVIRK